MKNFSVTIARNLMLGEIRSGNGFNHAKVVDLRQDEIGEKRPIEEMVIRRLSNHFIAYGQETLTPDDQKKSEADCLLSMVESVDGDSLVLTDDISHIAALCHEKEIPFTAKDFYVVETGHGGVVHNVPQSNDLQPNFGTFGA